jgi:amidase
MSVAGPIARSAEDLALAMRVLAGPEENALRVELPPPRRTSLASLRVAVWPSDVIAPVDDEIAARVAEVAAMVALRGGVVSDSARPDFDPQDYRRTYAALVGGIMGSAVPAPVYAGFLADAAGRDPHDASKQAEFARALVQDHRAWCAHDRERRRLAQVWSAFFDEWDVLVCPIMATTAFPIDERPPMQRTLIVNGQEQPFFDQVFWASLATLCGLPATVFPTGASKVSGLPIGLQAIGPAYGDATTIEVARLLGEVCGGFVAPPMALAVDA